MTDGSNPERSILITVCSTIYRRRYKNTTFHPFFQGFEDDGWVKPERGPIAADCGQDNSSGDQ